MIVVRFTLIYFAQQGQQMMRLSVVISSYSSTFLGDQSFYLRFFFLSFFIIVKVQYCTKIISRTNNVHFAKKIQNTLS